MARPTAEEQAAKREEARKAMRDKMKAARASNAHAVADEPLPEASTSALPPPLPPKASPGSALASPRPSSPPLGAHIRRPAVDIPGQHLDEITGVTEGRHDPRRPPTIPLPPLPTTPPPHSPHSSVSSLDFEDLLAQPMPKRLSQVVSSPDTASAEWDEDDDGEESELDLDEDIEVSARRMSLVDRDGSASPEIALEPSLLKSNVSLHSYTGTALPSPQLGSGYSSSSEEEFDLSLSDDRGRGPSSTTSRLSMVSAGSSHTSAFSAASPRLSKSPAGPRWSAPVDRNHLLAPPRTSLPASPTSPRRPSGLPKPRQIQGTFRSALPKPASMSSIREKRGSETEVRTRKGRSDSIDLLAAISFPTPPMRSIPVSPSPKPRIARPETTLPSMTRAIPVAATPMSARRTGNVAAARPSLLPAPSTPGASRVARPFGVPSPTTARARVPG